MKEKGIWIENTYPILGFAEKSVDSIRNQGRGLSFYCRTGKCLEVFSGTYRVQSAKNGGTRLRQRSRLYPCSKTGLTYIALYSEQEEKSTSVTRCQISSGGFEVPEVYQVP